MLLQLESNHDIQGSNSTLAKNSICPMHLIRQIIFAKDKHYTVEEQHTIQTDLFVYTKFHSWNIFQVIVKKQVPKYAHTFLV